MKNYIKKIVASIVSVALMFAIIPPMTVNAGETASVKSEIKSIDFEPMKVLEGDNLLSEKLSTDGSTVIERYYDVRNSNFSVMMLDGTIYDFKDDGESNHQFFSHNDVNYTVNCSSNQMEPWTIGTHEVMAEIWASGGDSYAMDTLVYQTTFTYEIVENQIEKVDFVKVEQIEETGDVYMQPAFDEDGNVIGKYPYYPYKWNDYSIVVTMKTGERYNLKFNYNKAQAGFEHNGMWYGLSSNSDQSYENQWGVGLHYFDVTIGGFKKHCC